MRLLVLAGFIALLALPAQAADVTGAEVTRLAIEDYILPGFDHLAGAADTMLNAGDALCAAPSEDSLEVARQSFKDLVLAFSSIEFIRFGPLAEENRLERLLFWPDRKGIALKQVQAILAEKDESAASTETLVSKSVAVQGLGTLEFVLFGTGSEALAGADGDFRCRFGSAIAGAIASVTADLAAEWNDPAGIAARMMKPNEANADFRSRREVLEALAGAIAHGIEYIRDTRLLPIVGPDDSEAPKPKSALFWRSDMTVPSVDANFKGLVDLFTVSRIGEATDAENLWVDNSTKFEFANALRATPTITLPVEQAVADPKQLRGFRYLIIVTQSLQTLVGENLAAALGLSVGFSTLDGD